MASLVNTVRLGSGVDRRCYELWCMHETDESLATGLELKRRAIKAGIRGTRADREHFSAHSIQLPPDLAGSFPCFTDDLDGNVLMGYMYTDGFGVWCYDQTELNGMCNHRTLFVRCVPNIQLPNCS